MKLKHLIVRNLFYYRRTNLAVVAGVAIATAVLSGALLVGQSIRGSLRNLLYQRIGATDYVVSADRFFREDLARALNSDSVRSCPIVYLQGAVVREETGSRALNVNVYGIDERFWSFHGAADRKAPEDRTALVGDTLARKLGVRPGNTLLLRIETQQGIPRESLYGRRENTGRTMRLICGEILSLQQLGEFALRPSQGAVYSIFVPLQLLQKDLLQPSRSNMILLASGSDSSGLEQIRESLKKRFTLQDLGISVRTLLPVRELSIESSRIILDASIAQAAFGAAADLGMKASGVCTYLANSIRAGRREIPYSVITGVDLQQGAMTSVLGPGGLPLGPPPVNVDDAIWLNDWAAQDLGVAPGDPVEVDYYLWREEGRLATETARFRVAGIVSIGGDIDAALAPDFPGITDARSINSWDPPFPLDLGRIRPKDEEYWQHHKTTPKAFVTLARAQELWQSRFGKLSAVRVAFPSGADPNSAEPKMEERLRAQLNPEQAGFSVNNVRAQGLNASRGSTDFGQYFIYFSFFLIASAVLLSALFFRLGVEQRVAEIGTLQALGFPRIVLRRIFLLEGALLSFAGSLLGVLGSVAYGWFLVFGLRTWWIGAVGTRDLSLHISPADLGLGAAAGLLASLGTIAWTLHGLRPISPRALLAGVVESAPVRDRRVRGLRTIVCLGFVGALVLLLASALGMITNVGGFFAAGFLLLAAFLSLTALFFRRADPKPIAGQGWPAFFRLGTRNAMHRPGRGVLCVALIASATFVIVSMEAFHRDAQSVSLEPNSGTGGYPLIGTSTLSIVEDPNSAAGRENLGIPDSELPALAPVKFVPFRLRPGDDVSCLNLYAPQEPRILGAPHSFLEAGKFSFEDSLATTPAQKANPWLLLESETEDGTIPAIGDANTIQYILHLGLGSELPVRRGNGAPARLRLVAALRDSIFQGELMISEASFLRVFPEQEGFRFFLLAAPPAVSASLGQLLEERLADWGFSVESSRDRLAAYHQVENTYLSTFQTLGALGLILGTAGLAAVLLRNVLERRKELALLRAVGYRRMILSGIVVAENLVLLIWGLACGTVCALLAILPALHARAVPFPAVMMGLILVAVLIAGLASSLLAVLAAFRSPLLSALRSE